MSEKVESLKTRARQAEQRKGRELNRGPPKREGRQRAFLSILAGFQRALLKGCAGSVGRPSSPQASL
jgi:hypothetical protein